MSNEKGLISKDMALFFGFVILFLTITIIKIVFFETKSVEPIVIEEDIVEEEIVEKEPNKNNEKAKKIMKNVYKNFEKRLEDDVNEASKVFNESVNSFK